MVRNEFLQHQTAQRVLQQQLDSGRLSHAYLFTGPVGVGKLAAARAFAAAINCQRRVASCACQPCSLQPELRHPDLHLLSPDGNSIKLQSLKSLLAQVGLTPNQGVRRVLIIDGADRLTREAANALLLTLEEPSASALFILIASSPVLPTILSRCQVISFHRQSNQQVPLSPAKREAQQMVLRVLETPPAQRGDLVEEIAAGAEGGSVFLATLLEILRALFVGAASNRLPVATGEPFSEQVAEFLPDSVAELADRCQAVVDAERMLAANVNRRLVLEQLLFSL